MLASTGSHEVCVGCTQPDIRRRSEQDRQQSEGYYIFKELTLSTAVENQTNWHTITRQTDVISNVIRLSGRVVYNMYIHDLERHNVT